MKNTITINNFSLIIITGVLGLIAAILVGIGEYLLHFDTLDRYNDGYSFMLGIDDNRSTMGHFFGVFGATLYPVGCYHIYLMLRSANEKGAKLAFYLGFLGFMVGAVWIGSRSSISALIQHPEVGKLENLVQLYEQRYETLLSFVRITVFGLSGIFVWLCLTGKSFYPRWAAIFNPAALIILSFVIYLTAPDLGKHLMPIALNVAFFLFFLMSLIHFYKYNLKTNNL